MFARFSKKFSKENKPGIVKVDKLGTWKQFSGLRTTSQDMIVFHGDSRPPKVIQDDGGLRRFITDNIDESPRIMDGGGTKNTVTTTRRLQVAVYYAARPDSQHDYKSTDEWKRYIYAMVIPAGEGIYLPEVLEESEYAEKGKITTANINTHEVLVVDVPIEQVIGWRGIDKSYSYDPANKKCRAAPFLRNPAFKSSLYPGTTSSEDRWQLLLLTTNKDFVQGAESV